MPTRVLLVDDSRAMRDYLAAILECAGAFDMLRATNGFDALRLLPQHDFDLIITDVNMPDVSGIELASFVRKSSRHCATPVLVISSEADEKDHRRAMDAGASGFMAKPFSDEQLLAMIADLTAPGHRATGSDT